MIRIHRVYTTHLPADRERAEQVKAIFRESFPEVAAYADKIPDQLNNPFRYGYGSVLLVGESALGRVAGFALLFMLPEINSALLDYLAVRRERRGGGVGSVLYEAAREYVRSSGGRGMYLEAAQDDPAAVPDPAVREQNAKRLAFYERYGARPIAGTDYETPISAGGGAPHLLFDSLGTAEPLHRAEARAAARLILRRKYGAVVPPGYIERVVESFLDEPARLRAPRYAPRARRAVPVRTGRLLKPFALVCTEHHEAHHVHDHGYVERPARVGALREALQPLEVFETVPARRYPESAARAVHDADFVAYLKNVCLRLESRRPVYPYVFPVRRPEKRPKDLAVRAGYYCIDTFTPLDRNAYTAARAAVDVALTAADELLRGRRVSYALCRPPGHHAERRVFGGFCYFNNAAIAAQYLAAQGRVATLDIDYHHGNGTQDIFYERGDVLTVSLHGHPNFAYPYFSGFADERGAGAGEGANLNLPLPEDADETAYLAALDRALSAIRRHRPACLVVSLGFDILKGDPTGAFRLRPRAMGAIGRRIADLGLPVLFVQEGGYNLRNLRSGATAFFQGVAEGVAAQPPPAAVRPPAQGEEQR